MAVHVLGISAFYHDSAAALIRDGEILAAAQEERFTRRKGEASFPARAIAYCLNEAGITPADLDYAVFYEQPLVKFERILDTHLSFAPDSWPSFRRALPVWATQKLHLPEQIRSGLDALGERFRGHLCFADHHESHAASAFYPSPFDEAAILTLDAVGEWSTSSIGVGRGREIILTHEMRFPHSLGMLYSAFTYYVGFKVNSGEYKLMGLAPYGQPKYAEVILSQIADVRDDGSLWLDQSYFSYCGGLTMTSDKFHELFGGPPRPPDSLLTQKDMDLAASIQAVCEVVILRAVRHAHRLTRLPHLVMAGGVALNCTANGRVIREGPFERVWIQPAAGDAGGALGAALLVWHQQLGRERRPADGDRQRGSLLGPAFSNHEIGLFLDSLGAHYEYVADEGLLCERVAELLARELTIGWFHGRMEYGPRALGSRSIIADARTPHMQRTLNQKIKFRESFRPFAACVLRDHVHLLFATRPCEDSPYMLVVAPVREQWRLQLGADDLERMKDPDLRVRIAAPRSTVPAVTHVDYSSRIQTVDRQRHGRFCEVLARFHARTGSPVLVNTSFNVRGEPIVCTPEEAYRCFMATDLDCLVLENHLLMKQCQPAGLREDAGTYSAHFAPD